MNKEAFISVLSTELNLSRAVARETLTKVVEVITNVLKKDGEINLSGFGKFRVAHRAERKGFNPLTKEKLLIPPTTVPIFKANGALKELIARNVKCKATVKIKTKK